MLCRYFCTSSTEWTARGGESMLGRQRLQTRKLYEISLRDNKSYTYHPESFVSNLMNSTAIPFEYHAYEALFTTASSFETQRFNTLNNQLQVLLSYFKTGALLSIDIQEQMRSIKLELSEMSDRVASSVKTLEKLLDDKEQMALMNLSVIKTTRDPYRYDCTKLLS